LFRLLEARPLVKLPPSIRVMLLTVRWLLTFTGSFIFRLGMISMDSLLRSFSRYRFTIKQGKGCMYRRISLQRRIYLCFSSHNLWCLRWVRLYRRRRSPKHLVRLKKCEMLEMC
jgi:hypothetical protein